MCSSQEQSNTEDDSIEESGDGESASDTDSGSSDDSSGDESDSNSENSSGDEDEESSEGGRGNEDEVEDGDEEGKASFVKHKDFDCYVNEQATRLASKREDYEKLRELSAHMDNVVHRLSRYFPFEHDNKAEETEVTLLLPPLPDPPIVPAVNPANETRDAIVSARVFTIDRAVSARRLTTDRAVSVASGLHSDELSDTVDSKMQEKERARAPSGTKRDWGGGGEVDKCRMRPHAQSEAAMGFAQDAIPAPDLPPYMDSNHPNGGMAGLSNALGADMEGEFPAEYGRENGGMDGSYEHMLWDELRESLAGAVELGDVLRRGRVGMHGNDVGRKGEGMEGAKERRRLIEQSIAVLLEDSEDEDLLQRGEAAV